MNGGRKSYPVILTNGTQFVVGDDVLAELRKGTTIKITAVKDDWVGGTVPLEGEDTAGWVKRDQVRAK